MALDPGAVVKRPALITLLAVLQLGGGVLMLVIGLLIFVFTDTRQPDAGFGMGVGILYLLVAALYIACGAGLWSLRPYGRTLQIVIAGISLLGVPIGTVIGALILYYMYRPGIVALFSGKPGAALSQAELEEIAKVTQRSSAAVVFIVILMVLGGVMLAGIVAAIAIPALLRARMAANEASAIGSMRMIVSAQASYASAAGSGWYATRLATLARACPGTTQGFITADLASDPSVKSGYTINLESAGAEPGPPDCNGVMTEKDFYATASPVKFEETGRRGFSASARGLVYERREGTPPTLDMTLRGIAIPASTR